MKINDIQKTIIELRDALAKHELLPVMLRANDALDALEKLKPTTITDDPATWPPETKLLYIDTDGDFYIECFQKSRTEEMTWLNDCGGRFDITGHTWQYLPEWEG